MIGLKRRLARLEKLLKVKSNTPPFSPEQFNQAWALANPEGGVFVIDLARLGTMAELQSADPIRAARWTAAIGVIEEMRKEEP